MLNRFVACFLFAGSLLAASDPFFAYVENAGQEEEPVKYRLQGVSPQGYIGVDSIHLLDGYGSAAIRFSDHAPAEYRSEERWPGIVNRFEGPPSRWRRAIPAHRRVRFISIATNVDAIFGSANGAPTLTFVIRPGGEVSSLFLERDASQTTLDARTGIWSIVGSRFSQWPISKPRAWQQGQWFTLTVDAGFRTLSANRVGFATAAFDPREPLYLEVAIPVALADPTPFPERADSAGNRYGRGVGYTDKACSAVFNGNRTYCPDVVITGAGTDGEPRFLTTLAGSYDDVTSAPLLRDPMGNLVIAGRSGSADFPVTADAHQPVNAGPAGPFPRLLANFGGDLFVSIVDPQSGDLVYSTFLGGSGTETFAGWTRGPGSSIALVATGLSSFPVQPGAWLTNGNSILAVFDPAARKFTASTFLPPGFFVNARLIGPDGSIFLAGASRGGDFTSPNALQPGFGGGNYDGYLLRIAGDGTRPLFATYLGGPSDENLGQLALDSDGGIWVTGGRGQAPGIGEESFLAHVSADGGRLSGPPIRLPRQFATELKVGGDGAILLSANIRAAAATTTPDAYLRGACGDMFQSPNFFQAFRADGSLRYSTYLLPGEAREVDAIYSDYLNKPANTGTPFLACVTDAANRRNNGSVSPGQIVTILGNGIGPSNGVTTTPGPDGRYPTAIGDLRVFAGDTPLPLLYADAGQINAILPFSLQPAKSVTITVEFRGQRLSAEQQVIPASIHLFSLDGSGSGQAVALNEDGRLNSLSNPAWPGSIVVIYATGGGATVPPSADGGLAPLGPFAALPRPRSPVTVELSGYPFSVRGEVLYAGAAPGLVNGLMQINIRLPDQLPASPLVFASFVMGSVSMQNYEVSIAVGPRP